MDGFDFVYWGHEGGVAVPVAVLLAGSCPGRSARRWDGSLYDRRGAHRVFIRTVLFLLIDRTVKKSQ